jgi:DNA-binding protein HU-beta
VNKAELIDEIARAAEISRSAAERAIDAVIASIKTSLRKDDPVTLVGFGSFYTTQRAAREGRNPRTGAAVSIGAARVPKFRAGKALKDALN